MLHLSGFYAFVGSLKNLKKGVVECGLSETPNLSAGSKAFLTEEFWSEDASDAAEAEDKSRKIKIFPPMTTPDGKVIIVDPECPTMNSEVVQECLLFVNRHGSINAFVETSRNSTLALMASHESQSQALTERCQDTAEKLKSLYNGKMKRLEISYRNLQIWTAFGWITAAAALAGAFILDRAMIKCQKAEAP